MRTIIICARAERAKLVVVGTPTLLLLGVDRDHIARARARGRRGEGQRNMPLTLEELQEIQADLMADDIEIVRLQKTLP